MIMRQIPLPMAIMVTGQSDFTKFQCLLARRESRLAMTNHGSQRYLLILCDVYDPGDPGRVRRSFSNPVSGLIPARSHRDAGDRLFSNV